MTYALIDLRVANPASKCNMADFTLAKRDIGSIESCATYLAAKVICYLEYKILHVLQLT